MRGPKFNDEYDEYLNVFCLKQIRFKIEQLITPCQMSDQLSRLL